MISKWNKHAVRASLIRSLRYDLRPEFRNKKFSYHFITPILKSQNSVAQIQNLLVCTNIYLNDPVLMLVCKKFQNLSFNFQQFDWLF